MNTQNTVTKTYKVTKGIPVMKKAQPKKVFKLKTLMAKMKVGQSVGYTGADINRVTRFKIELKPKKFVTRTVAGTKVRRVWRTK